MNQAPPRVIETASWSRRILALLVDWFASTLAVLPFATVYGASADPAASFYVLGVFVVESAVLTALLGGSFGKIATRLRVVHASGDPRPPGLLPALARQILVAVVVPPLVFRPDGRGLHDIAAGTATVTLSTFRSITAR
ncbi:RDD family protein [Nocardioides dokdonensis FR1436]|uniref:RDD family protein n=1 Tax=Nocardioides dokdonensis FR1436 TaxID=1300347 RepID=A0A1A9GMI9_9ACTN|nr:RDD family protein [Nocardioides dokdonensis]ANH39286.1 RDD family protein [Nocardioides dokdonensis FR1436]